MDNLIKEAHDLFERLYEIIDILNKNSDDYVDLLDLHDKCYRDEYEN